LVVVAGAQHDAPQQVHDGAVYSAGGYRTVELLVPVVMPGLDEMGATRCDGPGDIIIADRV
jgi:hypothetical protein